MTTKKHFKIGKRIVGSGYPSYIIFEVASTHSMDWNIAKDYVTQAREVGADAVKFQLFTADNLLNPISSVLLNTYRYFQVSETPKKWFPKLLKLCQKEGVDLLCTPFDNGSATFLSKIGLPALKIASGDLTNHMLLTHIAKLGKPVVLSTGMANMKEVQEAMNILTKYKNNSVALLQCTSVYPMPYESANVRAMNSLKRKFRTTTGYSDNGSRGIAVPLIAIAMGASIVEKHVTSQKSRDNVDDKFSLSIEEFSVMVKRIREIEKIYKNNLAMALNDLKKEFGSVVKKTLGSTIKKPSEFGFKKDGVTMNENKERHWARRGVYPKINIPAGTKVEKNMLICLRPDVGVPASKYNSVVGKLVAEDLQALLPIKLNQSKVEKFNKKDILIYYKTRKQKEFANELNKTALFD